MSWKDPLLCIWSITWLHLVMYYATTEGRGSLSFIRISPDYNLSLAPSASLVVAWRAFSEWGTTFGRDYVSSFLLLGCERTIALLAWHNSRACCCDSDTALLRSDASWLSHIHRWRGIAGLMSDPDSDTRRDWSWMPYLGRLTSRHSYVIVHHRIWSNFGWSSSMHWVTAWSFRARPIVAVAEQMLIIRQFHLLFKLVQGRHCIFVLNRALSV